ncbi:cyclase family protein [Sphingomonas sp. BT-65]|uniref:cyclase family protein n=1 Tax=Sphingomonas sp. BT-65 TaxID=2989821 RepID=UPI002235EA1F|nr:cyclase family protein [Sphingomonas sp. BT-65]MCW4460638.1 cyclase family protein [Sphingomonas sp. BT-65]
MTEKRVCFDFEVSFTNGGGVQGQDFRLDIDGDDIDDAALARYVISDLRLLMVGEVRILNKRIVEERHKRGVVTDATVAPGQRLIDLSHVIEAGMITYKGLPAPLICDHLSREASRAIYAEGTEFQIDRIELVGNTGTYLDTPYHRYADGHDLADLPLARVADCEGVVVRVEGATERAIDWTVFAAQEVRDRAVLVHTGWDQHWRTDQYFEGHPHLTEAAAAYLRDQSVRLVGIDSFNIDNVSENTRPVHSVLLAAGIPIVEHMTRLGELPPSGFRFSAVPPKVRRMGTFPVRPWAILPG